MLLIHKQPSFSAEIIMVLKSSLILISLIAILLLISCSRSEQYIDDGIADDEYIRIADGAANRKPSWGSFTKPKSWSTGVASWLLTIGLRNSNQRPRNNPGKGSDYGYSLMPETTASMIASFNAAIKMDQPLSKKN